MRSCAVLALAGWVLSASAQSLPWPSISPAEAGFDAGKLQAGRGELARRGTIPEKHWSIGYGRAYEVDGLKLYANWRGGAFTARAAARVGQLMMLQGRWNGRELIRREIVTQVLTDQRQPRPPRGPADPAPASGLAWYMNTDGIWPAAHRDTFAGAGAQHQVIVVVPSLDLIVVRNGNALADISGGFWGPVYDTIVKPLLGAVTVTAPYPPSTEMRSVSFGSEIRRRALGSDNWPLTWGADDWQYTSYADGFGFDPLVETKLGVGFARLTGGPDDYRAENIRSDGERIGDGPRSPKASGLVMVDGVLYLWVRNVANAGLRSSRERHTVSQATSRAVLSMWTRLNAWTAVSSARSSQSLFGSVARSAIVAHAVVEMC